MSAGSLGALHRLVLLLVNRGGLILHVQASGCHLEFRHRAKPLVELVPVSDLSIDSQSKVRPNTDGREACLERQCPLSRGHEGCQPTKPLRPAPWRGRLEASFQPLASSGLLVPADRARTIAHSATLPAEAAFGRELKRDGVSCQSALFRGGGNRSRPFEHGAQSKDGRKGQ